MNKIELQDHQINDYENICDGFNKNKMLLYVTATGNGKSYITGKYIQDNELKALIITPAISISRQWESVIDCDTMTYQKLYRYPKEKIEDISKRYDFFVIDEAHHAGAPVWRRNIDVLKDVTGDKKILGLTANPIRYNDYESDVTRDIFDEILIEGRNLSRSINEGILPNFELITTFYENPYSMNDPRLDDVDEEKRAEICELIHRLNIEINNEKLKEIIFKHLPKDKRKIIVFVPDVSSMDEIQSFLDNVFENKDYTSFNISSHKSQRKNEKIIKEFEKCESDFSTLMSVNMMNEGRHIPNVNTLIMIRRTKSPQIYLQQLGRGLTTSNKTSKVIVYDLVNNYRHLEHKYTTTTENDNSFNYGKPCNEKKISNQIICTSYVEKSIDIISRIEYLFMEQITWSDEEIDILKEKYPEYGKKVTQFLPGRTEAAVSRQAMRLGLKSNYNPLWTEDENRILKEKYPEYGKKVTQFLPGRTEKSISYQASKLGLKMGIFVPWTDAEKMILKEKYPEYGGNVCEFLPGRTAGTCHNQARKMGLKSIYHSPWTEDENRILKEKYPEYGKKVTQFLPGRTETAVIGQVRKMRLRCSKIQEETNTKTEKEKIEIIKKYFPIEGVSLYVRIDGMTPSDCLKIANELGLINKEGGDKNDE